MTSVVANTNFKKKKKKKNCCRSEKSWVKKPGANEKLLERAQKSTAAARSSEQPGRTREVPTERICRPDIVHISGVGHTYRR